MRDIDMRASYITISIVIPCFNAEKSIRQTVISCLRQSVAPHEIILVDDASTDNTAMILNELKTQHPDLIRVISSSTNRGVSRARNQGWEAAGGDYIAFLDSDDSFHREKLQLLRYYISSYGRGVYWHPYVFSHMPQPVLRPDHEHPLPGISLTSFSSLLIKNPVSTCTLIVPANLSLRFDEKMRYCEDHDLVLRCAYTHPLHRIPLELTEKVCSEGGLSRRLWHMRKGEIYMYSKLYRLHIMFIFLQPLLILFSLIKHLKLLLSKDQVPGRPLS